MKKGLLISIGLMLLSQHANAQTYFDVYELGHVNPSASIAASSIDSIGITGSTEQNRNVVFYKGDNSMNSHLASGIDSIKVRRPSDKLRITVNGVSFNMVMVSGGTFQMGATSEQDSYFDSNERPVHQVTLSDYHIGETEVTQELWQAVMGSNPSYFSGSGKLPVECVSWNACQTFIKELNQLTGMHFRLPTEAEWEFAARGGNKSKRYKYSGSNYINTVAWYSENSSEKTHEVGIKSPNELGLYDMSGNVAEWCQDIYYSYCNSPQTNPIGPSSGSLRVYRGGCWRNIVWYCRVSYRYSAPQANTDISTGLRLALTVNNDTNSDDTNNDDEHENDSIITITTNGVSFNMVMVSGGTFQMGATSEQGSDAYDSERPFHQVTLSDYYIGETEVTQELWQAVMGNNPSSYSSYSGSDKLPVDNVSWDNCQTFITKLNEFTGMKFRLPTEAEWEYAARGGNKSKGHKYSGSYKIDDVAWYYNNSSGNTHEVGLKSPNELGIFDMSGNVAEWCQDWYILYSGGPISSSDRVYRGGDFHDNARRCRTSYRSYGNPSELSSSLNCMGLRLALSINDDEANGEVSDEGYNDSNKITFTANGVSFKMVKVSSGTFQMGASPQEGDTVYACEIPAHQVMLYDYFIGEMEVTQELWQAVMCGNPSLRKNSNQLPVENVSWNDCQIFIKKLNQLTGIQFRLPTEAEWEFAARGGNRSKGYKYSGSNDLNTVAWYGENSGIKSHEVGMKLPNELGIYDMSGNVAEWCQDRYGDYSSEWQTNPTGPTYGSIYVLRGGHYVESDTESMKVSYREGFADPLGNRGLRLALNNDFLYDDGHNDGEKVTVTANGISFNMVKVSSGTFQMGSNDSYLDERPVHQVTLSGYYIGETEVTQELWQAVMGSNPSHFTGSGRLPIEKVLWIDCQTFITKLNQLTGLDFRLPTEAEWEFAARGGNLSQGYKYSGSNDIDTVAWYGSNSSSITHEVGTKSPNELGIYDMSGNVEEWCLDIYDRYNGEPQTNPTGPSSGSYRSNRVYRGGNYYYTASVDCRVSRRGKYVQSNGYDSGRGLRLALAVLPNNKN